MRNMVANMGNRDYTTEILTKKSRHYPQTSRWERVAVHLRSLDEAAQFLMLLRQRKDKFDEIFKHELFNTFSVGTARIELEQYLPIRSIACIEGYFRSVYADLIDFGDPYRSNASKLDHMNFSIETAFSIQSGTISTGEFIAHHLPLSSFEHINKTMSTLIGDDFLKLFKEKRDNLVLKPAIPSLETSEDQINYIKSTFKLRNRYCHEIGMINMNEQISIEEPCVRKVIEFIWITEKLLVELANDDL